MLPAATTHRPGFQSRMTGWELHEYGDFSEVLEFQENLRIPKVTDPKELIVRVTAASVNPLDLAMSGERVIFIQNFRYFTHLFYPLSAGYGASLLNVLRGTDQELPLRLGRDFCGEIVYRGAGVSRELAKGEMIWGVVPPHRSGCHAELVKVHEDHVTLKPEGVSDEQAGVIPYAGLTAWSGLFLTGDLSGCGFGKAAGKKVLILGGSGGVGTMAVQMCRAENCHVVATGSADAEELVRSLGADEFIDYRGEDFGRKVTESGPWDVILDCAGQGTDYADQFGWKFKNYVTFSSPLLRNIDSEGLLGGGLKSVQEMLKANCMIIPKEGRVVNGSQGMVKWGYFVAHLKGLKYLKQLTERGQLKPVISHRVAYKELPKAFELLNEGHLRGKIAINQFGEER